MFYVCDLLFVAYFSVKIKHIEASFLKKNMAGYKRCQHSGIHNAHTLGKIKLKLSEDLTIAPLQRFSCCKKVKF